MSLYRPSDPMKALAPYMMPGVDPQAYYDLWGPGNTNGSKNYMGASNGFGMIGGGGGGGSFWNQGTWSTYGSGAGSVGLGLGLGSLGAIFGGLFGNRSQDSAVFNPLAPPPPVIEYDPVTYSVPDTQVNDPLRPQLVGVANQFMKWNVVPQVLGKDYKMYPFVSANPYKVNAGDRIHVVYDFGYGELEVNDIKIGNEAIDDLDNVEYELQVGADSDDPITLYTNDVENLSVQEETEYNTAITKRAPQNADEIIIEFAFDSGLYQFTTVTNPDGSSYQDRVAQSVGFKIEYRKVGDVDWTVQENAYYIGDETSVSFRKAYSFKPPARALYDVRVTRISAVGDQTNSVDACTYTDLTAILYEEPFNAILDSQGDEVRIARLAVKAESVEDMAGTLQQVSAVVSVLVPTWDKDAQEWTDPIKTDNPAWLFLHVLRGSASGKQLVDSRIDLDKFADWAAWCEANNRSFNAIIDTPMPMSTVLDAIASNGRANWLRKNGKVTIVWDTVRTAVSQYFSIWNSWSLRLMARQSLKTHGFRMVYVDRDADFQSDERIAFNDGYSAANARRYEQIQLFGCTDPEQAYRDGRYQIAVQELRSKVYEFYTDWEYLSCSYGDLIRVNNDVARFGQSAGFITSVTLDGGDITAITLSQPIEMTGADDYAIRIRKSDGEGLVVPLVRSAGLVWTVTPLAPIPASEDPLPAPGDMFLAGAWSGTDSMDSALMLIIGVEPAPGLTARIICQEYQPGVYAAETEDIPDYVSQQSQKHKYHEAVAQPVIVQAISDHRVLKRLPSGVLISQIQLSMGAPPSNVEHYQARFRKLGSSVWSPKINTKADAGVVYISDVEDSVQYEINVRSLSYSSIPSPWRSLTHTVIGKTSPPPDPPSLTITPDGKLHCPYGASVGVVVPLDFAGLQLRMNWGDNEDWEQGTIITQLSKTDRFDVSGFAKGLKTFMVKAVDVVGNLSENASVLKRDFGDVVTQNLIETYDYHPTFPGTLENCSIVGDQLEADDDGSLMWPPGTDAGPFYPDGDADVNMWDDNYLGGSYTFDFTPDSALPVGSKVRVRLPGLVAENYAIEYQFPDSGPFWTGDDADPMYDGSNSDPFFETTAATWLPMPDDGIVILTGEKQRFRITWDSSRTKTVIPSVTVEVDVPDKVVYLDDVIIDSGGSRAAIPDGISFGTIKTVIVTVQNATGKKATTLDKNNTLGPLIQLTDKDDNPVGGSVDVLIQGYGELAS